MYAFKLTNSKGRSISGEHPYTLDYNTTDWVRPKIGKLFVFDTVKHAEAHATETDQIRMVEVEGLEEYHGNVTTIFSKWKSFWSAKNRSFICPFFVPLGTHLTNAVRTVCILSRR